MSGPLFLTKLLDKHRSDIAELEKANELAICSLKVGGKMNQLLTAKVAELEKELSDSQTQGDKALAIRDLEQQAKGAQMLLGFSFEMNSPASEWVDVIYLSDVEKTILSLFNKAKALKVGE